MRISDWSSDVCSSDLRVLLKEIVRRQREPAAVEDEAMELARTPPDRRQETPPARRHLVVEMREEGAGDVADAFGMEEIELHETFDRALARAVGAFHAARDLALDIEGTPVIGASRAARAGGEP